MLAPAASTSTLIDSIIPASAAKRSTASSTARRPTADDDGPLTRFLTSRSTADGLSAWFAGRIPNCREDLVRRLNRDVAVIDELLNQQLNVILHHSQFQQLEARWRGLQYLTDCAAQHGESHLKLRVLNASWKDLERDFERALEFDQSHLFRKVYEDEFGMAGGQPFGALIADYEIHPWVTASHPHDDVAMLKWLSQVGAAAFCPIIANASPAMFELDQTSHSAPKTTERRRRVDDVGGFAGLQYFADHARRFGQLKYLKWRQFRDTEDARFLALALPKVLMRRPYQDDGTRIDRFCFDEEVSGPDRSKYLWGGAAFAMGEVLIRTFAQANWLADIRGVHRDELRGGLVTGLPAHPFSTDADGVTTQCSTDVIITDDLERQLSDLGFIPLCHCRDTEFSAFYSTQSAQKPKQYDDPVANTNAQISSMLQYMMCVSRFAHYIKVLAREKIGRFDNAGEFQQYLQDWIVDYVNPDVEASVDIKARRPLREAEIKIRPIAGKPGSYHCTMHLSPHYELDELIATVRLVAELSPPI